MSDTEGMSLFQKKLAEKRAREQSGELKKRADEAAAMARKETEARVAATTIEPVWDDDLIPDVGGKKSEPTDLEKKLKADLDKLIDGIDIIEAYHRWCGKMRVDKRRRTTEGIKVSCPLPGHVDANPSAWLNTEKNVWYCGRDAQGGDVYDLAAMHYGFPIPGYKEGGQFHELRKKIAESYGFTFMTAPGLDKPILVAPEVAKKEKPGRPGEIKVAWEDEKYAGTTKSEESEESGATVSSITPELDDPGEERISITLDWKELVDEDTFLAKYMEICTKDDVPEEYHFWNGMMALGMAAGRDVVLDDYKPVLSNIFVCLTGPTGDGKSRSFSHLSDLLYLALPYKPEDPTGKGVDFIKAPGSAEMLISMFMNPIADPTDPKKLAGYAPVKGLIEFNELSALVSRAARKGSAMKPTLMEFYDANRVIQTGSLTHGTKRAENAFGSLFTTTQPKALKDLLREGDASSGFLNRFIFASGTPKARIGIGGKRIKMDEAVKPLQDVRGWVGFGRTVELTTDATDLFNKYYTDRLMPVITGDDSGLLDRMDLLIKKLILLFAINRRKVLVDVDLVERAFSMMPYLTRSYAVPGALIGATINTEVEEELMRHIRRHTTSKGGISMRDLMKLIKRKKFPLEVVTKTIKQLSELGFIEAFTTSGVGRPTVKYKATAD